MQIGIIHVMNHPVYVTVTGTLFYDCAHEYMAGRGTGRGKKGMESKTLRELHPVASMAFAPVPSAKQRWGGTRRNGTLSAPISPSTAGRPS